MALGGEGDANCVGLLCYADGIHISLTTELKMGTMDCVGDRNGFLFT